MLPPQHTYRVTFTTPAPRWNDPARVHASSCRVVAPTAAKARRIFRHSHPAAQITACALASAPLPPVNGQTRQQELFNRPTDTRPRSAFRAKRPATRLAARKSR
jgi:hypothetical protein